MGVNYVSERTENFFKLCMTDGLMCISLKFLCISVCITIVQLKHLKNFFIRLIAVYIRRPDLLG